MAKVEPNENLHGLGIQRMMLHENGYFLSSSRFGDILPGINTSNSRWTMCFTIITWGKREPVDSWRVVIF